MPTRYPPTARESSGAALEAPIDSYRNWVESLQDRVCSGVTVDRYEPPVVIWFLHDGPAARVEINVPFHLQRDAEEWQVDPWTDRAALGPVLLLIDRRVTVAVARKDGSLRLEFSDGVALAVPAAEGVTEPWWYHEDPDKPGPLA